MAKEAVVIELLWDIIRGRTGNISKVTYAPQKPVFPEELPYEQPFERVTPESQGIPSGRIEGMFRALAESPTLKMHSVMVLRNGKVIGETGFYPYQKELWHACYSVSKSLTAMAIGFLVEEEKLTLDEKIVDIFKKYVGLRGLIRQKDLTVEHLLTMTSGVGLNEVGAVSGDDWVKSYLEAPVNFEPGEKFEYNSMNSYMLSAIVTEITGESLLDYLRPRLFAPLGITRVFWESCPKGISKGGWGLFLCAEDLAKLGQLYLNKGLWNGVQVLPASWVEASTTAHALPSEETGFAGYGYQLWTGRRTGSFAFNGMLGQNVFVYPDDQMVVVTTAGSDIFFNSHELSKIRDTYLPPEGEELAPLPENPEAYESLQRLVRELSGSHMRNVSRIQNGSHIQNISCIQNVSRIQRGGWGRRGVSRNFGSSSSASWLSRGRELSGRRFVLEAAYVGLFPLLGQVFHNNYTEGIREIGFCLEKDQFYLELLEGEVERRIPVGVGEARILDLDFAGEPYRAAVEGRFTWDEDENPVLVLDFVFLEEAIQRRIKCFFKPEGLEIRFSEIPGKDIVMDGMNSIMSELMEHPLLRRVNEKGNVDLLKVVMGSTLEPVVKAKEIR